MVISTDLKFDDTVEVFNQSYLDSRGTQLHKALAQFSDPTVVALDGGWGAGKSFFLKRWVRHHSEDMVYLDAFKADYLDDPLVALVQSILMKEQSSFGHKALKKIKNAAPFIGRMGIRAATFGALQGLDEAGDIYAAFTGREAEKIAAEFWKVSQGRSAALTEFREGLIGLSDERSTPLIFVVDEIDRCRPDYALQLLEVIKHVFDVPNVHFVLGMHLDALAHSVKARYGADFNGLAYLQRFIHVVFPMQTSWPDSNSEERDVSEFFIEIAKRNNDHSQSSIGPYVIYLRDIPKSQNLTYRDMQRLYVASRFNAPRCREDHHEVMFPGLLILKTCRRSLFNGIVDGSVDGRSVVEFFGFSNQNHWKTTGDTIDSRALFWNVALGLEPVQNISEYMRSRFAPNESQGHKYPLLKYMIDRYCAEFRVS